jgi:hypothetical protein
VPFRHPLRHARCNIEVARRNLSAPLRRFSKQTPEWVEAPDRPCRGAAGGFAAPIGGENGTD